MSGKESCDLKGFLTFSVLWFIGRRAMSGQDIREEFARRKGCSPSAGTIYPVLKDLKANGFIMDSDGDGRTKRYKITKKGERELAVAVKKFIALFGDVLENAR